MVRRALAGGIALLALTLTGQTYADAPPQGYVLTPSGFVHESCAHEVPWGSHLDGLDVLDGNGHVIKTLPKCQHPVIWNKRIKAARDRAAQGLEPDPSDTTDQNVGAPNQGPVPATDGWTAWSWVNAANINGVSVFNEITGHWTVPALPANDGRGLFSEGDTVFLFNSLQSFNTSNATIIQPVLQFGPSAAGHPGGWAMSDWLVNDNTTIYTPLYGVHVGDTIVGTIYMNGGANYRIQWSDTNMGVWWYLDISLSGNLNGLLFNTAQPGVLETYGISQCNQFPSGDSGTTTFAGVRMWQIGPTHFWNDYDEVATNPTTWQRGWENFGLSCNIAEINGVSSAGNFSQVFY